MNMTSEHLAILSHAEKNERYCGDSPEMQELVAKGLMRSMGFLSWVPDEYFCITNDGETFLREFYDSE